MDFTQFKQDFRKGVRPLVLTLDRLGFNPLAVSFLGLAITAVSGWIISTGALFLGAIVFLLGSGFDMLDGDLARLQGTVSKRGAFLDSGPGRGGGRDLLRRLPAAYGAGRPVDHRPAAGREGAGGYPGLPGVRHPGDHHPAYGARGGQAARPRRRRSAARGGRRVSSHGLKGKSERGLLITFEGPEGSGKTTLIKSIAAEIIRCGDDPLLLREPGGTAIGERIRNILLDRASGEMCAETELLLMEASRAQLVREKIRPALEAGLIILCDRFADASVAYQGYGRGLGEETVEQFNSFALGGVEPALTFLCLLPPEEGRARQNRERTDRLDRETKEFHRKVYKGYQALAGSGKSRFHVLDAAAPAAAVLQQALDRLRLLEHGLLKYL